MTAPAGPNRTFTFGRDSTGCWLQWVDTWYSRLDRRWVSATSQTLSVAGWLGAPQETPFTVTVFDSTGRVVRRDPSKVALWGTGANVVAAGPAGPSRIGAAASLTYTTPSSHPAAATPLTPSTSTPLPPPRTTSAVEASTTSTETRWYPCGTSCFRRDPAGHRLGGISPAAGPDHGRGRLPATQMGPHHCDAHRRRTVGRQLRRRIARPVGTRTAGDPARTHRRPPRRLSSRRLLRNQQPEHRPAEPVAVRAQPASWAASPPSRTSCQHRCTAN